MKPELTTLKKLRDMLTFMNLPVYSYIDSDDFAILKVHEMGLKMPYITPTFRPDHYTLVVVKEGEGTFVSGNEVFKVSSGHVFIKRPDIYVSSGWTEMKIVYNICFRKDFIAYCLPLGVEELLEMDHSNGINYLLNDKAISRMEELCLELYDYATSMEPIKDEIISNILIYILLLIQKHQNEINTEVLNEKNAAIVTAFRSNMDKNFTMLISGECSSVFRIKEHAELLNISESNLSKIISKSSGKTVNQWINEKLIDEITYLLKNTEKSMNEIAEVYAFREVKQFYSFFKKHTHKSAIMVRNDFNATHGEHNLIYKGDVVPIRPNW
ncbi:helix-turn-helix domain-containing protein [Flavobacterium sp. YJ01]|uniref:AraC family transcriptional regulator n=1 Tax=unclassified Flavobacterium TaxID=196869 RepID=UPI0023E3CE01|nr:helix-turn-helix domain-containing protein [Flavobacterium sp. YJ01]WET04098.1 helix-turn-helix domain-containing protein [Flavobacterium sp. YJ01]